MNGLSMPCKCRAEIINLRVTHKQKALIAKAADTLGRSRSNFIRDAACQEAETVLLDRRDFALSEIAFKRFTDMLDKPPVSNPRLERLLRSEAPWSK